MKNNPTFKRYFNLLMSIYVFFFIFSPPIVPGINTIHLLSVLTLIYLFVHIKRILSIFSESRILPIYLSLFSIAFLYIAVVSISSFVNSPINTDNYLKTIYKLVMFIFPIITCSTFIIFVFHKNNYDIWKCLKIIVYAGAIQGIITAVMVLSPTIRQLLLNNLFFANGINPASIPTWEINRRYFAYSDSMLDTLGYASGIIAALPIFIYLKERSRIILLTPLLLLVPLFNSVTGLVLFAICATVASITKIATSGATKRSTIFTILASFVIILSLSGLSKITAPTSYDWVAREVSTIMTLGKSSEGQITSVGKLFSEEFWSIPSYTWDVFFGIGHTIYQADGFTHSDVGFINNIWLSGVLGSILLYGSIICLMVSTYRTTTNEPYIKTITLSTFICFFIFEIKGYGIGYNPGSAVILLINIAAIYLTKKQTTQLKQLSNIGQRRDK